MELGSNTSRRGRCGWRRWHVWIKIVQRVRTTPAFLRAEQKGGVAIWTFVNCAFIQKSTLEVAQARSVACNAEQQIVPKACADGEGLARGAEDGVFLHDWQSSVLQGNLRIEAHPHDAPRVVLRIFRETAFTANHIRSTRQQALLGQRDSLSSHQIGPVVEEVWWSGISNSRFPAKSGNLSTFNEWSRMTLGGPNRQHPRAPRGAIDFEEQLKPGLGVGSRQADNVFDGCKWPSLPHDSENRENPDETTSWDHEPRGSPVLGFLVAEQLGELLAELECLLIVHLEFSAEPCP